MIKIDEKYLFRVSDVQPELLKKPTPKTPFVFVELPVFDWVVVE